MYLPENIINEIKELICRPEGTFELKFTSDLFFDTEAKGYTILDVVAGAHIFRLFRSDSFELSFVHASPGTGTRIATIDLYKATAAERNLMAFTWSTKEIALYISPRDGSAPLTSAKGVSAPFQLQVAEDGAVIQLGSEGVQVMGATIHVDGKRTLSPTAIQTWKETLEAVSILTSGIEQRDYSYKSIITNLSLVMLITGFEVYGAKRFRELEKEGIRPNIDNLITTFLPKRDRDAGMADVLAQDAADNKRTALEELLERRVINFQIYESAKKAFNKAYGIKFGELGVSSDKLDMVQKIIRYRHRIIHVSPQLGILNQDESPPAWPVFPTLELAREAIVTLDDFISAVHEQSLRLHRID